MNSRDEMSQDGVDENLAERFPASDPPSWTSGTNHNKPKPMQAVGPRGKVDWVFHRLAKALNGLHWIIGITTLPDNASPREERSFVLMWLGIIVLMVAVFAIMLYLLG